MSRTKNSTLNIFSGLINKLIGTVLPFIARTVIINELGINYLGLNSLFASILQVLSLAELGFSTAIIFALHKPIVNGENELVFSIIDYFKKIYKVIGFVIFSGGILLVPFLHFLIKADFPNDLNVFIVYFLFLLNSVISYFTFAYRSSLLVAYQKNYLILNISSLTVLFQNICQIIVLVVYKNYYFYILLLPFFTFINNLVFYLSSKTFFPKNKTKLDLPLNLKMQIIKNVKGIMIFKIASISRNTFDSLLISTFIGLSAVGVYNNYYYIINSIGGFLTIITTGIVASVGNSIASDSVEKNFNNFRIFNYIYITISAFITILLSSILNTFIVAWIGEENSYGILVTLLFPLYFYLLRMGDIRGVYNEAAGLFWQQKNRVIIEAIMNLILNVILILLFDVVGIILATIFTVFFFGFLYSSIITFREYFGLNRYISYLIDNFKMVLFIILSILLLNTIFLFIPFYNIYLELFIKTILSFSVSLIMYFLIFRNEIMLRSVRRVTISIFKYLTIKES